MTRRSWQKDLLDILSNFTARNQSLPVFVGVGLAVVGLVLSCFPALTNADGFGGWLVRSDVLLHLGVIVGLLGMSVGDARQKRVLAT